MASDWELETPEYVSHGLKVFNCFLLGNDDEEHVNRFLDMAGFVPGIKICDMGCGIGYVTDQIRRRGFDVNGVTNSPYQYKFATKSYPETKFFLSDMLATPFCDASFDVIQWLESIGYTEQYRAFSEAYRILKKGGRAIVKDFSALGDCSSVNEAWSYNNLPAGRMIDAAQQAGLHLIKGFCFLGNSERFFKFYHSSRLLQDIHRDNLSSRNVIPFWYDFIKL